MNLKTLRKAHSLTQAQMADILCISQSNYSKYERGSLILDQMQLVKLSNHFHISIDELCDNIKPFQKISDIRLNKIINQIKELNTEQLFAVEAFIKIYKERWLQV